MKYAHANNIIFLWSINHLSYHREFILEITLVLQTLNNKESKKEKSRIQITKDSGMFLKGWEIYKRVLDVMKLIDWS